MAICGRALQFWDGQQMLRLQQEQERSAAMEKRNTKLKGVMTEMHAKQVSAVNIMQAKISSLEKELESERFNAQTLQAKLQNEARQKRRLEEECTLLDQRRWLRNNFLATALKPQRAIQNALDTAGTNNADQPKQCNAGVDYLLLHVLRQRCERYAPFSWLSKWITRLLLVVLLMAVYDMDALAAIETGPATVVQ